MVEASLFNALRDKPLISRTEFTVSVALRRVSTVPDVLKNASTC